MKIENVIKVTLFLFAFTIALPNSAQAFLPPDNVKSFEAQARENHSSEVYVTDLNIGDIKTYKVGEVIKGSFVLYNNSDLGVFGLTYDVQAVGGLDTASSRVYDVAVGTEKFSLKAMEKRTIPFTYTIPGNFNGENLAILVQGKTSDGLKSGWAVTHPFSVVGGLAQLEVAKSSIEVRGNDSSASSSSSRFYQIGSAPFIYQDKYPENAFAQFVLKNTTSETITVVPIVDIAALGKASQNLFHKEYKESVVISGAGETSDSVSLALPNFDWKPGVYEGSVSFKDLQGNERADKIHFKYVVGGEMYNILSLESNMWDATKGVPIQLLMKLEGSPFDMYSDGSRPSSQVASVYVTLFNEKDGEVVRTSQDIDFLSNPTKIFVVKAGRDAKALRANVEVKKGDVVIGTYAFNLSPEYDAAREAYKKSFSGILFGSLLGKVMSSIVVLLVVMSLVYLIYKRK
jgi:hypothetical protein